MVQRVHGANGTIEYLPDEPGEPSAILPPFPVPVHRFLLSLGDDYHDIRAKATEQAATGDAAYAVWLDMILARGQVEVASAETQAMRTKLEVDGLLSSERATQVFGEVPTLMAEPPPPPTNGHANGNGNGKVRRGQSRR
jgi:hypothetical protein